MRLFLVLTLLVSLSTPILGADWEVPHNDAGYSGLVIGCGGYAQTVRDGNVTSQARIEYDYSPLKQEPPLPPLPLSPGTTGQDDVAKIRHAATYDAEMKIFSYLVAKWKGIPIDGTTSYPYIRLNGKVEADGYASNENVPPIQNCNWHRVLRRPHLPHLQEHQWPAANCQGPSSTVG